MSTGVLYEAPGRTRARHRVYTVVAVLLSSPARRDRRQAARRRGQFAYDLWEPFVTPVYVRAILVDGLMQTS